MFTSSIKSKSFFNGEFKVEVEFTNGNQTWTETFLVRSKENLNSAIKQRLVQLNELATYNTELTIGAYVPTDASTPPTQADIDQTKWFRDFNRLERVTKLKDLGGMPVSWTTDLATLTNQVQTNAKKAYIADM